MHVKDYERLIEASQAIMGFATIHLVGLIRDEAYDTDTAQRALDDVFSRSEIPDLEVPDLYALRLCRQAMNEVFDKVEEFSPNVEPLA